tara:strand:+ start:203 stop:448 length:246 start_codon:yes stop_codon:yes gene_type:complete
MDLDRRMANAYYNREIKTNYKEWVVNHFDILTKEYDNFVKMFEDDYSDIPPFNKFLKYVWNNTKKMYINGKYVARLRNREE